MVSSIAPQPGFTSFKSSIVNSSSQQSIPARFSSSRKGLQYSPTEAIEDIPACSRFSPIQPTKDIRNDAVKSPHFPSEFPLQFQPKKMKRKFSLFPPFPKQEPSRFFSQVLPFPQKLPNRRKPTRFQALQPFLEESQEASRSSSQSISSSKSSPQVALSNIPKSATSSLKSHHKMCNRLLPKIYSESTVCRDERRPVRRSRISGPSSLFQDSKRRVGETLSTFIRSRSLLDFFTSYTSGDFGSVSMENDGVTKIMGMGDICLKTGIRSRDVVFLENQTIKDFEKVEKLKSVSRNYIDLGQVPPTMMNDDNRKYVQEDDGDTVDEHTPDNDVPDEHAEQASPELLADLS
ncbi:uncharacterized protein LOC120104663 [Phoenix dactylifera]|uniref:Uncharacterized protein LOC120104663 n=1 Tax=Phoenix dactylifera TaxID=42345 RepID=A0A8B8ZKA0_PHODC|nr:uncharacterized protein LOC120104663 [Phoenix dactylifera]